MSVRWSPAQFIDRLIVLCLLYLAFGAYEAISGEYVFEPWKNASCIRESVINYTASVFDKKWRYQDLILENPKATIKIGGLQKIDFQSAANVLDLKVKEPLLAPAEIKFSGKNKQEVLQYLQTSSDIYYNVQNTDWLRFANVHQDGTVFELHDYNGNVSFYSAVNKSRSRFMLEHLRPDVLLLQKIDKAVGLFEKKFNYADLKLKQRLRLDFILAQNLAHNQASASATLAKVESIGLVAANKYMIDILAQARSLNLKDLKKLNLLASYDSANKVDKLLQGIVRGTKEKLIVDRTTLEFDFTHRHVFHGEVFEYVLPEYVPGKMGVWINKVNALNRMSTLAKIVELSQEFIEIHPFTDGNGRTAKIMIDYMLLKCGFPPLAHDPYLTKNMLFTSPEQLTQNFAKILEQSTFSKNGQVGITR